MTDSTAGNNLVGTVGAVVLPGTALLNKKPAGGSDIRGTDTLQAHRNWHRGSTPRAIAAQVTPIHTPTHGAILGSSCLFAVC